MVALVVGLGVSIAFEWWKVDPDCFQTSISAYYYTPSMGSLAWREERQRRAGDRPHSFAWIRAVSASLLPYNRCRSGTGCDRTRPDAWTSSAAVVSGLTTGAAVLGAMEKRAPPEKAELLRNSIGAMRALRSRERSAKRPLLE